MFRCHICGFKVKHLNGLFKKHYKQHVTEQYSKLQYKIDVMSANGRNQPTCKYCNKPIIPKTPFRGKYNKFCNNKCKFAFKKEEGKKNKKEIICNHCGKKVLKRQWEIRALNFCDKNCYLEYLHKTKKKYVKKIKTNFWSKHKLSNGKSLSQYSKEKGANYWIARSIFVNKGDFEAIKYIDNYKKKIPAMISDKMSLNRYCNKKGIPTASAIKVYNKFGIGAVKKFITSYKKNKTYLESAVESSLGIKKYDKQIFNEYKYRPDFKISEDLFLDVDGLYWHSNAKKMGKDKKYHFNKRSIYEKNSKRLIQIREDEINDKINIVKSIIKIASNEPNVDKVFARKTKVSYVSYQEASTFFDKNHLMGSGGGAKAIGLYYNNKLVMCLSYKKYKGGIDISRVCSKLEHIVVGGLGKLIKYIEKEESPKFIQSFVDLRYGTGKSLETLGFFRESVTLGWKWTDGKNTFNRLKCRANMDERRLSESQHAEELGWHKIYDAGQAKYIKTL